MEFKIPDFDTVLEIHGVVIEAYGGLAGIPRPEYIESAIHRPQSYMSYDNSCDIHLVAAIVLDSIARYHAFADGNKRTALLTTLYLYNSNGIRLSYTLYVNKQFESLVLQVAKKDPPTIEQLRLRLKQLVETYQDEGKDS